MARRLNRLFNYIIWTIFLLEIYQTSSQQIINNNAADKRRGCILIDPPCSPNQHEHRTGCFQCLGYYAPCTDTCECCELDGGLTCDVRALRCTCYIDYEWDSKSHRCVLPSTALVSEGWVFLGLLVGMVCAGLGAAIMWTINRTRGIGWVPLVFDT